MSVITDSVEKIQKKMQEEPTLVTSDQAAELKRSTTFRVSDAIRDGSSVVGQAFGSFADGNTVCALSAAYVSAKARGYVD